MATPINGRNIVQLYQPPLQSPSSPYLPLQLAFSSFFDGKRTAAGSGKSVDELKTEILKKTKGTKNGVIAPDSLRIELQVLIDELEKKNPIKAISTSSKMGGVWKLAYSTNGGSSAGKLGPFIGDVTQEVKMEGIEYINYVRFLNGAIEASLVATWDTEGAKKLIVKFQTLALKIFGQTVTEKPMKAVGVWRLSYLDDNFRVLYAMGGKNVEKENVYVLYKE